MELPQHRRRCVHDHDHDHDRVHDHDHDHDHLGGCMSHVRARPRGHRARQKGVGASCH
jgi:hypothetical protein